MQIIFSFIRFHFYYLILPSYCFYFSSLLLTPFTFCIWVSLHFLSFIIFNFAVVTFFRLSLLLFSLFITLLFYLSFSFMFSHIFILFFLLNFIFSCLLSILFSLYILKYLSVFCCFFFFAFWGFLSIFIHFLCIRKTSVFKQFHSFISSHLLNVRICIHFFFLIVLLCSLVIILLHNILSSSLNLFYLISVI